ncbi:MAG: AmmeMemoRadiSam system protein B [Acidobacteria bacterium]|nr:AmmeMemoRadiSam system protein B [Acidobacteriota bacterium]
MERQPAVAGTFYEGSAARLTAQVAACFEKASVLSDTKLPMIGAIVPHAGFIYSGHVAAELYASVALPSRFVILCPNHTGRGRGVAINSEGSWITPLGKVRVDEPLAAELRTASPLFEEDSAAHAREHSLEVQLPLLQHLLGDRFTFVPVCMMTPSYAVCAEAARAIAHTITEHRKRGETIGIIASSDMNHYLDQSTTLMKDQRAIDEILRLDPKALWNVVHHEEISMCGYIPATTMLIAARELGATRATLIRHATSGDVSGDYGYVVGYASIVIH